METCSTLKQRRLAATVWRAALLAAIVGVVVLMGLAAYPAAQVPPMAAPPAGALEPAAPAASSSRMVVSPATVTVQAGESFSVTVMVSSTEMMRGAQAGLLFDPAFFQATGWEEGALFKDWAAADGGVSAVMPQPVIDNGSGTISVAAVFISGGVHRNQGPMGAGSLLIYHLRARPCANGPTTLTLGGAGLDMAVYDVNGYPLQNLVVTGGQVQVASAPGVVCPRMVVSPVSTTVNAGESFTVAVMLSSTAMMRGAQAGLEFDPALLEATGWEEGALLRDWAVADGGSTTMPDPPVIDNVRGTVSLAPVFITGGNHPASGPTGAGSLLIYHLRARPCASGQSALVLGSAAGPLAIYDVSGNAWPNLAVMNGQVTVASMPGVVCPRMFVSPNSTTVEPGESFTVAVMPSSTQMMRGAQAGLEFDPARLEATGWEEGALLRDWAVADGGSTTVISPVINNVSGTISLASVVITGGNHPTSGPTGTGSLLIYHLRARPCASRSFSLVLGSAAGPMAIMDPGGNPLPDLAVSNRWMEIIGALGPTCSKMYVVSPDTTADPFSVTVMISSATMMRGAQAGLKFDPALLEATGWEEGTLLKTWAVADGGDTIIGNPPVIDNVQGAISLAPVTIQGGVHPNRGPTGAGSLFIYHLRPRPGGLGHMAALTLSGGGGNLAVLDVNGEPLDLRVTNGSVYLGTYSPCSTCSHMYVSPVTTTVKAGESFSVTVVISSTAMMRGAETKLRFDPTFLEVTGWVEGTFLKDWALADGGSTGIIPPVINNVSGTISLAEVIVVGGRHRDLGAAGAGSLLVYGLRARPGVSGQTAITLSDMVIYNFEGKSLPNPIVAGGLVTVSDGAVSVVVPGPARPDQPITVTVPVTMTGGIAQVTLRGVQAGGTLTITPSTVPPAGLGFKNLATHYEASTTARFSGTVTLVLPYNPAEAAALSINKSDLRLFHWESGRWQDVTNLPVDTDSSMITGTVGSLSPFVLGVPNKTYLPLILHESGQ